MKLPLFRLIHDIINENADKSFANHVGCVMAHRNRPLFSVMNVTAITMHTASGLGKQKAHRHTHQTLECVNFIDLVHNSQQNHRSEFIYGIWRGFCCPSLDYGYSCHSEVHIFQVISNGGSELRVCHINCNTEPDRSGKKVS